MLSPFEDYIQRRRTTAFHSTQGFLSTWQIPVTISEPIHIPCRRVLDESLRVYNYSFEDNIRLMFRLTSIKLVSTEIPHRFFFHFSTFRPYCTRSKLFWYGPLVGKVNCQNDTAKRLRNYTYPDNLEYIFS